MQCMLKALSVVLGCPLATLEEISGGREAVVVDPMAIGANRFRGLHVQELTDIALSLGVALVPIELKPVFVKEMASGPPQEMMVYPKARERFHHYLQMAEGVLLGAVNDSSNGHAVAWKDGKMVDLTGLLVEGRGDQFHVEVFLMVLPLRRDDVQESYNGS